MFPGFSQPLFPQSPSAKAVSFHGVNAKIWYRFEVSVTGKKYHGLAVSVFSFNMILSRCSVSRKKTDRQGEEGVDVPYERLDPETLRNLIQEFVTRDGADWGEVGCSLEDKVGQVMRQLQSRKVKVVFDRKSQTANIVACR